MRLRESKELKQLVNLEPNPKLRSWDPRVRVLPNVLGKGANSTPQIIPQLHCGCLFHGGSWSPRRCKTFIGPHNLSGFTSYCGSSYHFSSGGVEGGHCSVSTRLSPVDGKLVTSGEHDRKDAWCSVPGNTQNLMFQSLLWKLDHCPPVSLYAPFMAACSVLWLHMCFFIGCCKLENIKSFGFGASLKMIAI